MREEYPSVMNREQRIRDPRRSLQPCLCVFIFFLLLSVSACGGKKEVKQVSQESKTSTEAFSLSERLRAAYVKKDFSAIQEISTSDGYKDFINSIKHFDSVDLTFTPKWVEIEKSMVYLNVAWKGSWVVGSETIQERGMAVFLFDGRPLRLSKIIRGNPFKYPER
ncbi:MAG TPA: hypothetical protein VFG09_04820 [Thermodesulfovibrionales bacterium]|jgi:hypothetical protein|nr:hypothetical protein [Thermodesulfovibrionales bacterium]